MSKKRKIKNIIEYIIVLLIISVNVFLIMQSVQNPNRTPALFGKKAFVIVSGSMIPQIQIGDIVIVNNTNDVQPQDIIAFRRNTSVIVHRMIKEMIVNGEVMYQTKGDNNNVPDTELVDKQSIEGVYTTKIPFVGKILIFLYNNLVLIIIAVIIIILIKNLWIGKAENNKA